MTTANRSLASLRACLQAAWRQDKIVDNPAARVRKLAENPPRARVLTDEELVRLVNAVDKLPNPFVQAAFRLLIETGARRSEVLNMRWQDLDLEHLDRATWRLPRPKSGRPEVKPLTRTAATILLELPKNGEYVVAGKDPEKPRWDLKRWWEQLRIATKLADVRIHDLRRTYGLAVAREAGLHKTSRLLGHADSRITERVYAPLGIDDLRQAAELVSSLRAKVIPFRKLSTSNEAQQ